MVNLADVEAAPLIPRRLWRRSGQFCCCGGGPSDPAAAVAVVRSMVPSYFIKD
ncbi:hypothetical protein SOVF_112620 [Spinacia oleracea]|nr:hypothetical protein SOVF_112620 [Spinacia oleracea]